MSRSAWASAAASGMALGAAVACGGQPSEPAKNAQPVTIQSGPEEPSSESPSDKLALPKREPKPEPITEERVGGCCKGMNECKGKGGCKTAKSDCAGKNECKGQGGCNAFCPR